MAGDGDAREDANEEATMAFERASSFIPVGSSATLELLLNDFPDMDAMLGVADRSRGPPETAFLAVLTEEPVFRGGSFGFSCSGGADSADVDAREAIENEGLGARSRTLAARGGRDGERP